MNTESKSTKSAVLWNVAISILKKPYICVFKVKNKLSKEPIEVGVIFIQNILPTLKNTALQVRGLYSS
jgi:hypothetical protein